MRSRFELRPGNRHLKPRLRNLRDVALAKGALQITCLQCQYQAVLLPIHLADRLGADWPVDKIGPRLRCTSCGAKGQVRVYESTR